MTPDERRTRNREASRRYRQRHPDRAAAAARRWREENRAKYLEIARKSKKRYYAENREKLINWQREYTKRNYESLRRGWLEYAASHREEARQRASTWRLANPERVKATSERRRETGYYRQPERRAKSQEWVDKNRNRVRDTRFSLPRRAGSRRRAG